MSETQLKTVGMQYITNWEKEREPDMHIKSRYILIVRPKYGVQTRKCGEQRDKCGVPGSSKASLMQNAHNLKQDFQ